MAIQPKQATPAERQIYQLEAVTGLLQLRSSSKVTDERSEACPSEKDQVHRIIEWFGLEGTLKII